MASSSSLPFEPIVVPRPSMPTSPALLEAIDKATPERLRATLKAVCASNIVAQKMFEEHLVAEVSSAGEESSTTEDEEAEQKKGAGAKRKRNDSAADAGRPSTKRPRARYVMCENCEEEFDVMNNDKGDCVYHPGELEVYDGDDFWADHDEDCHGVIDTEEMRKMFPEGFMWDCCEVKGDEPGCKESRHRPSRFFP